MGHFSHNCKLTGLPITDGTPVALIVMQMSNRLYDNSEENLRNYGSTYMCSNDGTRLKFIPIWLPIKGDYDDYGSIENIIEDDNTKMLEEYYDLSIQQIMDIITCGRKHDGYSDILKLIKEDVVYPEGWIEGESHFDYYQRTQNDPMPFGNGVYPDCSGENGGWTITRDGEKIEATKEQYDADFKLIHEQYERYNKWTENNPDPDSDYGNPQYQERYKELVTYSGMWVHGEVYDKISELQTSGYWNEIDLGTHELLEFLGFKFEEKTKDERYNRRYTKDGYTISTDGTWIEGNVYSLKDFKKLCIENGTDIDIDMVTSWSGTEQLLRLVAPKCELPFSHKEYMKMLKEKLNELEALNLTQEEQNEKMRGIFLGELEQRHNPNNDNRQLMSLLHKLLNTGNYGNTEIENPFTKEYFRLVKEGKLIKEFSDYWKFDSKMYATGNFYDVVGTGPQDGEHADVLAILKIAQEILEPIVKQYEEEFQD